MYLTFRIDDISINTDLDRLKTDFIDPIENKFKQCKVKPYFVFGVSPAVFNMPKDKGPKIAERIFPAILNAHSDQQVFYRPDRVGIPDLPSIAGMIGEDSEYIFCAHGMFHIDHRLISKEAQAINIMSSISLVKHACESQKLNWMATFIPPFNKINTDTLEIARDNGIHIIKWHEYLWRHLLYIEKDLRVVDFLTGMYDGEQVTPNTGIYLHTHDFACREEVEAKLEYLHYENSNTPA